MIYFTSENLQYLIITLALWAGCRVSHTCWCDVLRGLFVPARLKKTETAIIM